MTISCFLILSVMSMSHKQSARTPCPYGRSVTFVTFRTHFRHFFGIDQQWHYNGQYYRYKRQYYRVYQNLYRFCLRKIR
jgi:hypothetical protein